ncbi:hypothetical protein PAPYR_10735 [Paratrimastix pyriformis]|uniref:Uncharacterized protein n=1 Tax=Paratrimastix pyriformis TaxID=342808 RepID=A0ABQ8U590_9EUKA|nr:hypothetical protein PAPYR_10735 [Paratrimastix pyriformis]
MEQLTLGMYDTQLTLGMYDTQLTLGMYETQLTLGMYETQLTLGMYETQLTLGMYETQLTLDLDGARGSDRDPDSPAAAQPDQRCPALDRHGGRVPLPTHTQRIAMARTPSALSDPPHPLQMDRALM